MCRYVHIRTYAERIHKYEYSELHFLISEDAFPHFFFGVGFESALAPETPFSVLSIPDEVTRHSLLQWEKRNKEEGKIVIVHTQQL